MKAKIGAIFFLVAVTLLSVLFVYNREEIVTRSEENLYPAKYYETAPGGIVQCKLCPIKCMLSKGQMGVCKARINKDGKLYSMVYGQIAAAHLDPIEKKPFFHVLPGSKAFSIATTGCNLRCKFCQNWQISQIFPWETKPSYARPEEVVEAALRSGARSIAYTYNEPIVYIEYVMDIAKLAKEKGLKNIVVSAGYIEPEPLRDLLKYIDAIRIDLKGFNDKFYKDMTSGSLAPILETMKIIRSSGVWLEIVNLVIPTQNDKEDELKGLALWVKDNLGPDVPVHFTRFHPDYKIQNLPPTPVETLKKARKMALDLGLNYVYTGNINDPDDESTYCPLSKEKVIERNGFFVVLNKLKGGKCPDGEKIPGIWE